MVILIISPGYPADMPQFTRGLAEVGATVLGVGDQAPGAGSGSEAAGRLRSGRILEALKKRSADPLAVLRRTFRLRSLRPGQREVIDSVLAGHDTLAIMPSGAGKSLCYQLPGLQMRGATVVVSPLIALMKDQSDKLEDRGVSGTVSYPFSYSLGPRSTFDQKRAYLERFGNDVIQKLG